MATEGSGLYRTYDFGKSWEKLDFVYNRVGTVIIDPQNPSHYFAVTNMGSTENQKISSLIFESYDGGASWTEGWRPYYLDGDVKKEVLPTRFILVKDRLIVVGNIHEPKAIITPDDKVFLQKILSESNASTPFQFSQSIVGKPLGRLKMKDSGQGLISLVVKTEQRLYKTQDFGKTWTQDFSNQSQGYPDHIIKGYDISLDGKRISLALEKHKDEVEDAWIAKSANGGGSWEFTEVGDHVIKWPGSEKKVYTETDTLNVQDLILSESNPNYLAVFRYMYGLYESFDGGTTFVQTIDKYDVNYLNTSFGEAKVIVPLDLRKDLDNIKVIGNAPQSKAMTFLIPSDQGAFIYNNASRTLSNTAKKLYLGDTESVSVTSCPRIYAGLWHLGSFWINPDNTIEGFNGGEVNGYGVGKDGGCDTPVFDPVHGYLYNGKNKDETKTQWFQDNIDLGWPVEEVFQYKDGWWYAMTRFGKKAGDTFLVRVKDTFDQFETIYPQNDPNIFPKTFGLAEHQDIWPDQKDNVWVLDYSRQLWKSPDGKTSWKLVKSFGDMSEDFKNISYHVGVLGIKVWGNTIVLYGDYGLAISTDNGNQWKIGMKGGEMVKAAALDRCGTVYVALHPNLETGMGGTYYTKTDGEYFYKMGGGDQKSHISSLAVEHYTDALYAATKGESLMRIGLNSCPL